MEIKRSGASPAEKGWLRRGRNPILILAAERDNQRRQPNDMKTDIIPSMRFVAMFAILPAAAFGVTVGLLPPPQFIDTEVSATHRLEQPAFGLRGLDFRLDFNGTPSNNVEVAFGRDLDANGSLAPHETDVIVGWECGRYFIERFRTGERIELRV